MMDKLNLPVFTGPSLPPPVLSMNDYLDFVEFNLKYTFNREAYEKEKRLSAVDISFML